MDAIATRLKAFISYKGLSVRKFEEIIGMGNGSVSKLNKDIKSKYLEIIYKNFPELNQRWLLHGEGEMLENAAVECCQSPPENTSPPPINKASEAEMILEGMHGIMTTLLQKSDENMKQNILLMTEIIKEHEKGVIDELHRFEEEMLEKISESLGAILAHSDMGDIEQENVEKHTF